MKTPPFTDSQIIAILKQAEAGSPVPELCREHGISNAAEAKRKYVTCRFVCVGTIQSSIR